MSTRDVTLRWDDPNIIEKGYRVYRSDAPMDITNMPVAIADLAKHSTEYIDKDQTIGTTNYYRVSAWINGFEAYSAEVELTVYQYSDVILGTNTGYIEKVDSAEPSVLWSNRPYTTQITAMSMDQIGHLSVGYSNGIVTYYEGTENDQIWNLINQGTSITSTSFYGEIVASVNSSNMRIYNRYIDQQLMTVNTGGSARAVYVGDEGVYITLNDNLTKYDKTGTLVWQQPCRIAGVNYATTILNGVVFYVRGRYIDAYTVDGVAYQTVLDLGNGDIAFLQNDGTHVYAGYSNGDIKKIDMDMTVFQEFNLGRSVSALAVDPNGNIYVGNGSSISLHDIVGSEVWILPNLSNTTITSITLERQQATLFMPYESKTLGRDEVLNTSFIIQDHAEVISGPYYEQVSTNTDPIIYTGNVSDHDEVISGPYYEQVSTHNSGSFYLTHTTTI